MATSESDDFESADEECDKDNIRGSGNKSRNTSCANPTGNNGARYYYNKPKRRTTIGSDSDDDVDYIPVQNDSSNKRNFGDDNYKRTMHVTSDLTNHDQSAEKDNNVVGDGAKEAPKSDSVKPSKSGRMSLGAKRLKPIASSIDNNDSKCLDREDDSKDAEPVSLMEELENSCKGNSDPSDNLASNAKKSTQAIPEPVELTSNLKFKDLFQPDGWEGLNDNVELPSDFADEKYQPVLDKLSSVGIKADDEATDSWSAWGSWGVNSLLSTATASVSTVTSQVSRGFSLLEETIGVPNPEEMLELDDPMTGVMPETPEEEISESNSDSQSQLPSFGFGNFLSSMSSITKLVESTGSKVISGGLDTLETIGKKTMEVLQDGDPGLKKKRAFFFEENEKPNLSQILREAKEKADVEEKSIEDKQLTRKVHFESIFDDYQGLVHLEALEMLSKQCNMKIQQHLVNLDGKELIGMQETLDEIKDLCDLGEDEDDEKAAENFEVSLKEASQDLGISLTFDKLINVWQEIEGAIKPLDKEGFNHQEIFQKAISSIAQLTAYSVERYHKSGELLLIKERRSTVNETDSLVQITKILCNQVEYIANLFCNHLTELKNEDQSIINSNVTTIFMEATNASSYIQEAFRLLVPVIQVGAI